MDLLNRVEDDEGVAEKVVRIARVAKSHIHLSFRNVTHIH